MTEDSRDQIEIEDDLSRVLVAGLEAVATGRAEARASLLNQNPRFAGELAQFFAHHDRIDRLAAPLRALVQARPPSTPGQSQFPTPGGGGASLLGPPSSVT